MHAFTTPAAIPVSARGQSVQLQHARPRVRVRVGRPRVGVPVMCEPALRSADAVEFFKHREGRWQSRRVTHHLAFKRSESGESEISMKVLEADDERILSLCEQHEVDPKEASGGCYVTWKATMAWDQEGENHEGSTVFALVPDADSVRRGRILRDRGYAEIVPIAGRYELTEQDELSLSTPYEGGEVKEMFAFDSPNVCNRVSSVRRFGGIATATFSTETRILDEESEPAPITEEEWKQILWEGTIFGVQSNEASTQQPLESSFLSASKQRFADLASSRANGSPSTNSAFGSGFSSGRPSVNSAFSGVFGDAAPEPVPMDQSPTSDAASASTRTGTTSEAKPDSTGSEWSEEIAAAASRAGIELAKVPPSMRDEFLRSLKNEASQTDDR